MSDKQLAILLSQIGDLLQSYLIRIEESITPEEYPQFWVDTNTKRQTCWLTANLWGLRHDLDADAAKLEEKDD